MQSKREQWQAHVDGWESSGLSQSAWCRTHGLSLSSFGYWRRRLADADTAAPSAARLLPVRVAAPASADRLEMCLPNGIVLTLPMPADASGLEGLLRTLAAC